MVYARRFGDRTLTFGVSGKLIMNNLVMYDHQTASLWSQWTGMAVEGPMAGTKLQILPAIQTTWGRWKRLHPDTLILDEHLDYQYDSYVTYYRSNIAGFGGAHRVDRLGRKELVLGLNISGEAKAYAFQDLSDYSIVNDVVGGKAVVVTFDPETSTGAAFSRSMGEGTLALRPHKDAGTSGSLLMTDQETGSLWNMLTGEAIEGDLKGSKLERLPSNYSFWFAWKDWHPSTKVFLRDA